MMTSMIYDFLLESDLGLPAKHTHLRFSHYVPATFSTCLRGYWSGDELIQPNRKAYRYEPSTENRVGSRIPKSLAGCINRF